MTTPAQAAAFGPVRDLKFLDGENVLLGLVDVYGVAHHVTFVRVKIEDDMLVAVHDPHGRLDDILGPYEGPPDPVEIPGLDGLWICGVDPCR